MADFLFGLHSGVRYLVLAAWLVALAGAVAGLRAGPDARGPRITMKIFLGLLDLQFLIGLFLLMSWTFYPQLFGHIMTMLVAVIVAHGFAIAQRRTGGSRPILGAVGLVVTLLLIVAGISAIGRPIF